MSALKSLTKEMKDALGNQGLVQQYAKLLEKKESLIDDVDAVNYVKALVRRYQLIEATDPVKEEHQAKRAAFMIQLRRHVAEMSVATFSKPGDVASHLKEVGFASESIDQIVKGMEQAGGLDDFVCILISAASCDTSLASCDSRPIPVAHVSNG